MADKLPRTDLPTYFKGLSDRLENQAKTMTPVIVHSGEMGDNDHHWFADLLRQYLPLRYGVDTGFVVNCDSDKGSADFFTADGKSRAQDPYISNQMDILLLDVMQNAPFCSERTFKVCPTEMVLGAVEVTRDLDKTKLKGDVAKLSKLKQLAENKRYLGLPFTKEQTEAKRAEEDIYYQRPFTCVVGFGGGLSRHAVEEVAAACPVGRKTDAVLMLNGPLYYLRDNALSIIENDTLYHLITILRYRLDTHRCHCADLTSYLPPFMQHFLQDTAKGTDSAFVKVENE